MTLTERGNMGDLPFKKKWPSSQAAPGESEPQLLKGSLSWGLDVVITYREEGSASKVKGEKLCERINKAHSRAMLINCDISQKESVKKAIHDIKGHFGRIDFPVLNAAKAPFKSIEKLFERELRDLVNTNYPGHIFCIQESIPLLEKTEGKVVFISSLGNRFYNPSYPLGSMKAAMESVVRDCSQSLRNQKIMVNGVCGGIVKTDAFKTIRLYWENIDQLPEHLFVPPEEIADVVMFLCGPGARGMQGQILVVDRGLSNSPFGSF